MKGMVRRMIIFGTVILIALSFISCMQETKTGDLSGVMLVPEREEELKYAERFTLTRYQGGYSMFQIPGIDPDRHYLIVPEGKAVPENLPENTVVLQQPVTKICFASGSLASLAEALGAVDRITTVAIRKENWILDSIAERMESGEILYSGSYKTPDFEMLLDQGIQLEIDSTMLVSYPDIMEKYDELGIPYFIEDSAKESHPLGRMEWIRLLGAILGMDDEAERFFEEQAARVEALENFSDTQKTAALFYIGEKAVYVRNAGDYVPKMLDLAGGENICSELNPEQGGNQKMDFEEFYILCKDADYLFWVVMSCPYTTIEELIAYNELFADFKAVKNGCVYTSRRGFAQCTAGIADAIMEMNSVLQDPTVTETENFVKIK